MASAHNAVTAPRNLRRVVAASLVGTTIEWYDYFLYGSAAALVFGRVFFPDSDPLTGTMLSFLTYAIGFAARPLGALVFGHFGDRVGRKKLLVSRLLMMGGATALIGCVPGYNTIGIAAPPAAHLSASSRASRSAASGAGRCCWSPSTATPGSAASGRRGRRAAHRPAICWPSGGCR